MHEKNPTGSAFSSWPSVVCFRVAQQTATSGDAVRIERLAALESLWGAIKYFHPYLGIRTNIDWDKAVVEAIPKVNAAKRCRRVCGGPWTACCQAAGRSGDTRGAEEACSRGRGGRAARPPGFHQAEDGLLLVSMRNYWRGQRLSGGHAEGRRAERRDSDGESGGFRSAGRPARRRRRRRNRVAFSFAGLAGVLTGRREAAGGAAAHAFRFVAQRGASSSTYERRFI